MRKVVMQDIANRLNISKNSVSQALSGKDGVSEATRNLIINTANEMGYQYKKDSKKTSSDIKGNILLISSEKTISQKNFFGKIYLNIQDEAKKNDLNIKIITISDAYIQSLTIPTAVNKDDIDGIIILSDLSHKYINELTRYNIPTVLVDHHSPFIKKVDCILTQNKTSAFNAVSYLIENGHKKIGFIGDITISPSYEERYDGYLQALRKNHLDINTDFIYTNLVENQSSLSKSLDAIGEMPTAWFCVNSGFGFILSTYLNSKNLNVPHDISIFCFDDTEYTQFSIPPLSTIAVDIEEFGVKTIEILLWRIKNPSEPYIHLLLPTKMVLRESVATCND